VVSVAVVPSRRARFWGVTALAVALAAVDIALYADWMTSDPWRDRPYSAAGVLIDVVLVVVIVGYQLVRLPAVQSWNCVLVLALLVASDLQYDRFGGGAWFVTGVLASDLAMPALIALVLRYPARRLTTAARAWVGISTAVALALAVAYLLFLAGSQSTVWNFSVDAYLDPDAMHSTTVVILAVQTVPLVGTAVILLRRWRRSRGGARRGFRVLAGGAAFVALAAAVAALLSVVLSGASIVKGDSAAATVGSAWWASLIWLFGDAPLAFLVLPLAPLADVAWRRLAAGTVSERLLAAAAGGTGPDLDAAVALALGEPSARVVPPGVPPSPWRRRIPVGGDAGPLAEVDVDPGAGYTDDPEHVESVVGAVRLGLETVDVRRRLEIYRDEVDRSRRRVVEAAALERRRVERDLHDGAQQALLGLGAVLARASIEPGPKRLADALAEARSRLSDVIVDLDRLADGLYPEALDRRGLASALNELAGRCPLHVRLVVPPHVDGLPAAVKSVAWFVVAEALTNAVRHARATSVTVRLVRSAAALYLTVTDDGCGGVHEVTGGGLAGLRERVEAAGGSVETRSGPGGGSEVRVMVPLVRAPVPAEAVRG
jgi:signal transduction histidine kinase